MGSREPNAARSEPIQIRGLYDRIPGAAHVVGPHLVGDYAEKVEAFRHRHLPSQGFVESACKPSPRRSQGLAGLKTEDFARRAKNLLL
jgi:hypothetical protein